MTQHTLIWGWLRLFLGMTQITFSTAAVVILLTIGLRPIVIIVVASGLIATIISHLIYQGQSDK